MHIDNIIKCLEIVKRENPKDKYPIYAEHDVIYLGLEHISTESDVGGELISLGSFFTSEGWLIYP